jgi:glycerol uptake facilitator-like aquaporin
MAPSTAIAPQHIAFCDQPEFFKSKQATLAQIFGKFVLMVLVLGYLQKTFTMNGYR